MKRKNLLILSLILFIFVLSENSFGEPKKIRESISITSNATYQAGFCVKDSTFSFSRPAGGNLSVSFDVETYNILKIQTYASPYACETVLFDIYINGSFTGITARVQYAGGTSGEIDLSPYIRSGNNTVGFLNVRGDPNEGTCPLGGWSETVYIKSDVLPELKKESPLEEPVVGIIGKPLCQSLKVKLICEDGSPVPDKEVTFAIIQQPNGANGTKLFAPSTGEVIERVGIPINAMTDGSGIADVEVTLGSKEGNYIIQATYIINQISQTQTFNISGKKAYLELVLDKDPATYLPAKDDITIVKAKIVDESGNLIRNLCGRLVFQLLRYSDFKWSDEREGDPIVVDIDPSGITYPGGSATPLMLRSITYWGVATVGVYGHPSDNIGLTEVTERTTKQIPIDEDNDGIADSWENSNGLNPHNRRDGNEDNERAQGIHEVGDGFTAWNEYKGYKLSGIHYRMNPQEKEIFVNRYDAPGIGTYAIGYVRSIGISVIESYERPEFQGDATPPKPAEAIKLINRTTASATDNGIQYLQDGTPTGYSQFTLGQTQGINAQGDVEIFLTTINNYFDLNRIQESMVLSQPIEYPNSNGEERRSVFNGTDINGDGDTDDFINVFDWGDGVVDERIEGISKNELLERVPLHEIGHTFGLGEAPIGTFSVMRQGVTSQNTGTFTRSEIRDIRVWTWGR